MRGTRKLSQTSALAAHGCEGKTGGLRLTAVFGLTKNVRCQILSIAAGRPRVSQERTMPTTATSLERVKNQKGFTLIDMLFVIAIIGLLSTLAIPGLMRARGAAQSSSSLGTIRVVNSAQLSFAI